MPYSNLQIRATPVGKFPPPTLEQCFLPFYQYPSVEEVFGIVNLHKILISDGIKVNYFTKKWPIFSAYWDQRMNKFFCETVNICYKIIGYLKTSKIIHYTYFKFVQKFWKLWQLKKVIRIAVIFLKQSYSQLFVYIRLYYLLQLFYIYYYIIFILIFVSF